jgi:uncharacterized protein
VKSNRQFVIPFKGLKTGKHDFVFDIDDKFFDDFEQSEVTRGNMHVEVILDKKINMLELNFMLQGYVVVTCDRCLDDLELPVNYKTALYVNFGDVTEEQTDEIIVLSRNEFELDIAQYLYEYVHLALPYKRIHPDNVKGQSTCNKEMLKKIEEHLIRDNDDDSDPRWDDLKSLLNN